MTRNRQTPPPKLYSMNDVAGILGLSIRTIRRLIVAGDLMACRLGRSIRLHPDDLARYIDCRRGL